ncbi:MFS transporter [Pseudoalteromonas piscicida]|uniref:MFS transporter n=1 Tax=Pseudoalteromonas piscicida TaxID=43662 RepID=UPI0030AFD98D
MLEDTLNAEDTVAQGTGPKLILFCLAMVLILPTLGMSSINVLLPTLAEVFGAAQARVNWVVVAYLLAVTSCILGAGAIGDRIGRKRSLRIGVVIFGVASVAAGLSVNLWMLIAARLLQGVGAALLLSQVFALASSVMPKGKEGLAMGLLGSTAAIGTALGPLLSGAILEWLSWQFTFAVLVLLGGVAYWLMIKCLPDDVVNSSGSQRFDGMGSLWLLVACLFYVLAMPSSSSFNTALHSVFFLFAMVFIYCFVRSQKRTQFPLVSLVFLQHKLRNTSFIVSFIVDAIAMSTLVVGPFYLTYALELSPVAVGVIVSIGPFIAAVAGYPSGEVVDRCGIAFAMLLGLLMIFIGTLSFALLPSQCGLYGYIIALLVLTPGRQLFLAAHHTFVMTTVAENEKGMASGLINLSKNLGLMTGASLLAGVFSTLLQAQSAALASLSQLNMAFSMTFLLAALFILFSLVVVFFHSRKQAF